MISSILIGTTTGSPGQSCQTSCLNYVPPVKKLATMNSSDLTRIRRLRAISSTTPLPTANYSQRPMDYDQLQNLTLANRVKIPLAVFLGQNSQ